MSFNKDSVQIFKIFRVLPNLLKLLGNAVGSKLMGTTFVVIVFMEPSPLTSPQPRTATSCQNIHNVTYSLQISNEEEVAENCRLCCEKQGIPFYRFSPKFDAESDVKILPTETDVNKLSDLVLRAQTFIESAWETKMDILVQLLNNICLVRSRRQQFTFE